MVAPLREQLQKYHYTGALTLEKNIIAVITQGRVIDDNLESQIKNRTLCIDYSYQSKNLNILAIGQRYFTFHSLCSI